MKKTRNFVLNFVFVFILCLFVSACNDSSNEKKYVLKFETNCEQKIPDRTYVVYRSEIGELPEVTKKGYNFVGWYVNPTFLEGTEVTKNTLIGKNITIYAKLTPKEYNMSYDLNVGSLIDGVTYDFTKNKQLFDDVLELPQLEKDGYLFLGWTDESGNDYKTKIKIQGDVNLTAKFISKSIIKETYQITYVMGDAKFYQYDSYNDARTKLLADLGNGRENFSESSIDENLRNRWFLGGEFGFFSSDYIEKWGWILDYINELYQEKSLTAVGKEKEYADSMLKIISNVKENVYVDYPWRYWNDNVMIACEIRGFLSQEKYQTKDEEYSSMDYSQEELRNRIWKYIEVTDLNTYQVGEKFVLKDPMLEGKIFQGWYTNKDFTGERVYEIDNMTYGDMTLYAKFV